MFKGQRFSSLFEMEESVLRFWQKNQIFERSVANNADKPLYSFYDGPPFITGTPHYATLLPSIAKDVILRYQTMKGRFTPRVWGWDVHGLPAETQVEKQLGLKTKREIEQFGVDGFIAACRQYVAQTSASWRWYIDHIGRWVDLDRAYRTDQLTYMETVIWLFKQLYEQGLIYRAQRVSLYCPRCATPLTKFEITMDDSNYRMVEDPAITVAFRLIDEKSAVLAWTTTPWTLPANAALAVNPEATYVKVTDGQQVYILAQQALERYGDQDWQVLETFKGEKLVGRAYQPLYSFFPANHAVDYRLYPADFIVMEEGTGIVHLAPGYGEDDHKLALQQGISTFLVLDEEGNFLSAVSNWRGQYFKAVNQGIINDLRRRGLLLKATTVTHSYPHCYRCATPLIYRSQVSWYLKIDPIRQQLLDTNQEINWFPSHFGKGRFRYNLENAPDWAISRTRYWGTPIPVWETGDGEMIVVGSLQELERLSGQKITDLHRPAIDRIVLKTRRGQTARRVREVFDCWFESGAMPYGLFHYPFENKDQFERSFPADFIIEYTGQLRGWFYYLHVLANALRKQIAFKNVIVTGVLMGEDGRKMSKSYGNYPDPRATIEKYGAEALRLYLMGSRLMAGEDLAINEADLKQDATDLNILHHSFHYFLIYADLHHFQPDPDEQLEETLLDRWIKIRLEEALGRYTAGLEQYDLPTATRVIKPFIRDLSTWYIRRSRTRFVNGDRVALTTLYQVLKRLSVAFAPTLPFTSDYFYRLLTQATDQQSVHLEPFPTAKILSGADRQLLKSMDEVREISSAVHMMRAGAGLSLRQPLAQLTLIGRTLLESEPFLVELLREETNVAVINLAKKMPSQQVCTEVGKIKVCLDTRLTPTLLEEGRLRELVRKLQEGRKRVGLRVGELVTMEFYTADEKLANLLTARQHDLCRQVSLRSLTRVPHGDHLQPIEDEPLLVRFQS